MGEVIKNSVPKIVDRAMNAKTTILGAILSLSIFVTISDLEVPDDPVGWVKLVACAIIFIFGLMSEDASLMALIRKKNV